MEQVLLQKGTLAQSVHGHGSSDGLFRHVLTSRRSDAPARDQARSSRKGVSIEWEAEKDAAPSGQQPGLYIVPNRGPVGAKVLPGHGPLQVTGP